MFERFTNQSRRVVVLAQDEARELRHPHIGTEHLLLGLLHEDEGAAARALTSMDITLEAVRREVEANVSPGSREPSGHIPFTPDAKKSLELSLRESLQLGQNYIGGGHLLLGLIRQGNNTAVQILGKLGADLKTLRARVTQEMREHPESGEAESPSPLSSPRQAVRPRLGHDIQALLDSIDERLSAIERRLGIAQTLAAGEAAGGGSDAPAGGSGAAGGSGSGGAGEPDGPGEPPAATG